MANTERKLITIPQWEKLHGWPTAKALRQMILKNRRGFVEACVIRISGRVLIDEARFFAWVDESQPGYNTPRI